MKHLFCLLPLALLFGTPALAQGGGAPVGWLRLSADVPMRGRWSLYSEVESRQSNNQLGAQRLGRVGFRLHVAPCFSLTTGYVLAANEFGPADAPTTPEHRIYQEIALADQSGLVRASHRLRAEERWLRPAPEATFRFAARLRYQLRLVVPLHTAGRLPVGGTYVIVTNELFAGLGSRDGRNFIEENRASAGLGYRMSPRTSFEMTYLHQSQWVSISGLTRNAVQFSVAMAVASRPALVRL